MKKFEAHTTPENAEKPLFKVTLIRHEEPYYKDEGRDLTPAGEESARKIGENLKESGALPTGTEPVLLHSPKARAAGTLELIAEGAELSAIPRHSIGQLRASDIHDTERFQERVTLLDGDYEKIARDHHENTDLHENDPSFIEPSSRKKKRLYRALEYLVRSVKHQDAESKDTPHIIAVSHFEIITHIINDVFGIENVGKYNAPSFGELVTIDAYEAEEVDKIMLKVTYNTMSKEVLFDRKSRSVEILR